VNPVAVQQLENLFLKNERFVKLLDTLHFGPAAMIEVGALCVGKIVQSYSTEKKEHLRGEEKGYFLFGGSTVILLFPPGKVQWKPEFLEMSQKGIETFVKLGDAIGESATR
jgi:phosphatidylserine decarboxylase